MPHPDITGPDHPTRAAAWQWAKLRRSCAIALGLMVFVGTATAFAQTDEYQSVQRLVQSGQLDEASARADRYLSEKPGDPQMRFLKGTIQSAAGQPAAAMATFARLISEHPELPEPYNNLAVLQAAQGEFDQARASLETAIRVHPGYAIAHENLGDVQAQLASRSYRKALELAPASPGTAAKLRLIDSLLAPISKSAPNVETPPAKTP